MTLQMRAHAEYGPVPFRGHEAVGKSKPMCEPCRRKQVLQRFPSSQSEIKTQQNSIPPIVDKALRSPGQVLDSKARAQLEPRFGHDFSRVRIHSDTLAAESAMEVNARAYTIGDDIAFAKDHYAPETEIGRRLLAHELAHVVQQTRGAVSPDPELSADRAAEKVITGDQVTSEMIGGAPHGLLADGEETQRERPLSATRPAFTLSWEAMNQMGLNPSRGLSLGLPSLRPPSLIPSSLRLTPPSTIPFIHTPAITPSPTHPPAAPVSGTRQDEAAPDLPSRLPIVSRGSFSLGLRLGFPSAEAREIPGMPESALAISLRRAEIMNQMLTGRVPSTWEAVDKAQLAGALWGIFSTRIAPGLARSITSRLTTPAGRLGASYELDVVLLTDFSGGGLSFSVRY